MPKQTTNQLIDTITGVLMDIDWTKHFHEVDDMERNTVEGDDEWRRAKFQDVARQIAKAVR